jgi:hypothetical protein
MLDNLIAMVRTSISSARDHDEAPDLQDAWPNLKTGLPDNDPAFVRGENITLLRQLSETSLKSQVEGGRLNIARSYQAVTQAASLSTLAFGGAAFSSGMTGSPQGWGSHLSVTIGLFLAALCWAIAAVISLTVAWPRTFGAAAIPISDTATQAYLGQTEDDFNLTIVRMYRDAYDKNRRPHAVARCRLQLAVLFLAVAPIIGATAAIALRLGRLLLLG